MKTLMCQLNTTPNDFLGNYKQVEDAILYAHNGKYDLIVFPELTIPGYLCKDMMFRRGFVEQNLDMLKRITEICTYEGTTVIIGYIDRNYDGYGKPFRNMAAVIKEKRIIATYQKHLLPFYDVFDEGRYFEPGKSLTVIDIAGQKWGICICEDLWNDKGSDDYNYTFNPLEDYRKRGICNIISINSSPYVRNKPKKRMEMIKKSADLGTIIYCNQIGGQDELVFDGNSFIAEKGDIKACAGMNRYQEYDTNIEHDQWSSVIRDEPYDIIKLGLQDYLRKTGFKQVVVGSSGGIDSALVLALACDAIGPENVHGIRMPSVISSEHSKNDASLLHNNLGCHDHLVPIDHNPFVQNILNHLKLKDPKPIADENIQARLRGLILMYFSNAFNALLLSTGNKTELALGYCVDGNSILTTNKGFIKASELYSLIQEKDVVFGGFKSINSLELKNNKFTAAHKNVKQSASVIETIIGTRIRVSSDHEVKVFDPLTEQYRFKIASDVKIGELAVIRVGANQWGNSLGLPSWRYEKSRWDFKSVDFIAPKEITPLLAKLIGVCIADGSYTGGTYRIRSSKKEVGDFCVGVLTALGLSSKVTQPDERNCYFVEISNVQFMDWLHHIGVRHGASNKIVPDCILHAPKCIIQGFISGLMLDSCTDSTGSLGEITYHSVNEDLTRIVHLMMLNMGILCYHRQWKKSQATLYEVYIPASETYKLVDGFDFLKQSIKNRILDNLDYERIKYKSLAGRIYHNSKVESLYKLLGYNRGKGLKRLLYHNNGVGRDTLTKYYNLLSEQEKNTVIAKEIKCLIESDEYLVEVSSNNISDCNELMYDFSMSDVPEYTINGQEVHNCTLYGDMNGGFCPINDLYKMQVYEMAKFYNQDARNGKKPNLIPENILTKAPSAELAPGQTDEASLLPYPILDTIVKAYVESYVADFKGFRDYCFGAEHFASANNPMVAAFASSPNHHEASEYNRMIRLININEFKRRQAAPGIKITPVAFGVGRRLPIVQG